MQNSIVNEDGKVFDSCEAVYIFPNSGGNVSIKQYSQLVGDDIYVEIPLHFIEKTINALRSAKRDAEYLKDA